MAENWRDDKKWTDKYLPLIKMILGSYLIGEATVEEDQEHATDLIVLDIKGMRIAVRMRGPEFYDHSKHPEWRREFTIRAERPSGIRTELRKILDGWGDYLFYGFGEKEKARFLDWHLADLDVFRIWYPELKGERGSIPNRDHSSSFKAFAWAEFPSCFILASRADHLCRLNREGKTKEQGALNGRETSWHR